MQENFTVKELDSVASKKQSSLKKIIVQAQSSSGKVELLEFFNTSEPDAMRQAVARGLRVISLDSTDKDDSSKLIDNNSFPLLLFSQELLALLDAGLNLTEALSTLHEKERVPAVKNILNNILIALKEGKSFSDVLMLAPKHFPEVYIASVRASEQSGDLPKALERYVAYQQQFEIIRKKLISASIYPLMLLVVGGLVTLFLVGYVVPKFSIVYESSGREIPWLSSVLLGFGKLLHQNWQLALLAFVGLIVGMSRLLFRAEGRAYLLDQILRIPWLANKADEFRLARFYRAVSLLLSSGLALPRAMGMVTGMLSPAQRTKLSSARQLVEQGQSLSSALMLNNLASPVADSLIKVGEKSGQLAEMLERTARFQDEDFTRWIDWASKLLEPILMTIIGLVIGTIVTLMYIPIFDLAGSLR
jgi:general secretion pathway protein F